MKYAWIAGNKAHWPITLACDVLGVSASGYFEHGRRRSLDKPSKLGTFKRMSDEALLTHIRAIHAEVKAEYGWPKVWKELVARGHRVGKERVRRLMKNHGIVISRDVIMERVWDSSFEGESRTIDVHVRTLRQKLGDGGSIIKIIRNVGYMVDTTK